MGCIISHIPAQTWSRRRVQMPLWQLARLQEQGQRSPRPPDGDERGSGSLLWHAAGAQAEEGRVHSGTSGAPLID